MPGNNNGLLLESVIMLLDVTGAGSVKVHEVPEADPNVVVPQVMVIPAPGLLASDNETDAEEPL